MGCLKMEIFKTLLIQFRNIRRWNVQHGDPYAFRQVLILMLDIDTDSAIKKLGKKKLKEFDDKCREMNKEIIKKYGAFYK